MRKVFVLITCFYGFCLSAQDVFNRPQAPTSFTEDIRTIDFIQRNVISQIRPSDTNNAETVEILGSAYLIEEFKNGAIFYNTTPIGEYLLRYNVYGEEFEILSPDDTKSAVAKTSEVAIQIEGKKYVFKYFLDDDERSRFGYFEVISTTDKGHYTLLKKNKKILTESRKAVTSFDVNRPARFVDTEAYYLLIDDKEIVKIRPQNGYVSRFFKKRGVTVKSFLKEHNYNVKHIEDLKEVIQYCNSVSE